MENTMNIIAEYVWIDAYGTMRSKARTLKYFVDDYTKPEKYPEWNFDGSSTGQAKGTEDSEVILCPRAVYVDPFGNNTPDSTSIYKRLVLCDCYCYDVDKDILIPIESNTRHDAAIIFEKVKDHRPWFGLEQEYVFYDNKTGRPIGWPSDPKVVPEKQGKYYCGVGADRVYGREVVDKHYELCLKAGIQISGTNAEVMPGQWEFQVGPCEGIDSGDQLWMARYLLHKLCEDYDLTVSLDPKPEQGDWNGSGCHANYSTQNMREDGGLSHIFKAIEKLSKFHPEHIEVYGDNSQRLTGKHETPSPDDFTYGIADRTASIRIGRSVAKDRKGYFEDRRPASDCDPYLVTAKIAETTLL
jgi:glutamine synthetase